jgi:SAM domain (Sterile alpha motif)
MKLKNRGAAAMQQVADWLEKLGLGQYAQRFAENDISFAVLPDLTDQHLKEIGVSLGHRLQLLRAIAELTSGEKEAAKAAIASAVSAAPQAPPSHRDVLGPRRFDSTLGAYGPRRPSRDQFGLSEVRRPGGAALWRVRGEVHCQALALRLDAK